METNWVSTSVMKTRLGCSRDTLIRLKNTGFLRQGQHWRKVNPEAVRGTYLWHLHRVVIKMDAMD